jgi:predicted amidohydrolase/gas vesicle protein
VIRVGFAQFSPAFGEPERNIAHIEDLLAHVEADVVVLPELVTSGYLFADAEEVRALAEPPDGPRMRRLALIADARACLLVAGFPERAPDGYYNSAAVLSPDGVLAVYRKVHLFRDEKLWFRAGDAPAPVIRWRDVRYGLMICFDWFFPEMTRSLALRGAQVICHPANLVLPFCQDAMITRSLENRVFTITANRVGTETRAETSLTYTGRSQITAPNGARLVTAPAEEESVATVEIDPTEALDKQVTSRNDLWSDRRPDLYASLSTPSARADSDLEHTCRETDPYVLKPETRVSNPLGDRRYTTMESRDYSKDFNKDVSGGIKWPIAAAAGALVGAGLALLYAPRSGRETREVLKTGASKVKDGADVVADKIKSGAEAVGQMVGSTASKLTGRGEESAQTEAGNSYQGGTSSSYSGGSTSSTTGGARSTTSGGQSPKSDNPIRT